jgi:hypothetical protein
MLCLINSENDALNAPDCTDFTFLCNFLLRILKKGCQRKNSISCYTTFLKKIILLLGSCACPVCIHFMGKKNVPVGCLVLVTKEYKYRAFAVSNLAQGRQF